MSDKYNTNSKVTNYSDFCNNFESEKEKLKRSKRSFTPNSDRQNFVTNTRTEYNPVTHKLTDYTEDEIDDMLNKMDDLEEANESFDINSNSLYRNLMDVLSSSNASKKEKKDILEIILKEMSDFQKFINHR
jgi:hypothetical protein